MALLIRRILCANCTSPLIQPKRYKAKINLRKPQKPHFERAVFFTLAKPKFESKLRNKTLLELCNYKENRSEKIDNPYERIIAGEILQNFKSSKLIVFCHRNAMIPADDMQKVTRLFKKSNMEMEIYGKNTMRMALEGTPYESVLSFYFSHNAIIFAPEANIKKLLQICRKCPSLIVLAAILEGKFINKDELLYFSNIPNLQTAQAGLVQTLNSVGGQVVNQLNTHQNILVSHLEERIKQLQVK